MNARMMVLSMWSLVAMCCFSLTDEGRLFKEELQLMNYVGPTNRYVWTCPSEVVFSNTVFTTRRVRQNGECFAFDLVSTGGVVVADCGVKVAASAEGALDAICDRIRFGNASPIQGSSAVWRVERDSQGNILLGRHGRNEDGQVLQNRSEFFRTYGNLCLHVTIRTNSITLNAWDFALPLIMGGLQGR